MQRAVHITEATLDIFFDFVFRGGINIYTLGILEFFFGGGGN